MAKVKTAPPDPTTDWALGASLPLVGACLSGIALGWLAGTRSVGGLYITFLMPLLIGSLIGWATAFPARKMNFGHTRPLVAAALLGALVCFVGQQVFAFLNFAELLATQNAEGILANNLGDPIDAALIHIENATGETGYFAYLAFTAKMPAALASPVGLIGRLELGVGGTIAVGVIEFVLLGAAAAASTLWRTRDLREPAVPAALCDDAQLLALAKALESNDATEAAAILGRTPTAPSHAIFWLPQDAGIAVWALDSHARPARRRSTRQVAAATTRAIRDQLETSLETLKEWDDDGLS